MLGPRADAGVVGTGALTGGGPVAWGSGGWQLADARLGRCAGAACRRAGGCSAACDGAIPGAATSAARCRNGWIPDLPGDLRPRHPVDPDMANGVEESIHVRYDRLESRRRHRLRSRNASASAKAGGRWSCPGSQRRGTKPRTRALQLVGRPGYSAAGFLGLSAMGLKSRIAATCCPMPARPRPLDRASGRVLVIAGDSANITATTTSQRDRE